MPLWVTANGVRIVSELGRLRTMSVSGVAVLQGLKALGLQGSGVWGCW